MLWLFACLAGWVVAAFRLRVGGPEFLLLFIVVCSFTGLIDCSSLFIVVVVCIAVVYCLRFACLCLFVWLILVCIDYLC